ncbi:hypothetical protein OROMI_025048 [Orobanche minor]
MPAAFCRADPGRDSPSVWNGIPGIGPLNYLFPNESVSHEIDDASNFHNFCLKFVVGKTFEGDYLPSLASEIATLRKGALTVLTTIDLFCVSVNEGPISFKRLTQSEAAEAGFKL